MERRTKEMDNASSPQTRLGGVAGKAEKRSRKEEGATESFSVGIKNIILGGGSERGGSARREKKRGRDRQTETGRETEAENLNSKTLLFLQGL